MNSERKRNKNSLTNLDIKYGKIAENMERIMVSMEDTSRKNGEVLERFAQQQENFNKSIDKLTDAILFYCAFRSDTAGCTFASAQARAS